MRERYSITITSYRGARHYTLTQLMRRFLLGAVAMVALIVFSGSMMIYGLSGKVSDLMAEVGNLKDYQSSVKSENLRLLDEQNRLVAAVNQKAEALAQMSDELGHIEVMVGLKPEAEHSLYERLDTATQTAQEKRMMLSSIPSGYPLKNPQITSSFGMRRHPVLDRTALHGGVDMRASRGTPTYATADGVVEWASKHESSGLGNMIKLVHNYGFTTTYAHLDRIDVKVGDYVRQGDQIGLTGNTGVSSAPHLHYEVRHLHRRLNPKPFMEWSIENYDVLFTREERVKWESLAEIVRRTAVAAPERQWSQLGPALSALSN